MSELIVGGGDAVSRLIQLHATRADVRLKWTRNGPQDLDLLLTDYSNKTILNQCLWNGMKELMAMSELKELPEAVQAKIFSIVLQAQAVFELKIQARNQRRAYTPPPPMPMGGA
jgi:hypothetical protein